MKLSDFLQPPKPKKKKNNKIVWANTGPWMFYGFPSAAVQSGTGEDTISYGAGVTGVGDSGAVGEALQEGYEYGDDIILQDGWYLEWVAGKTNITDYYALYKLRRFMDDAVYGRVENTVEYPEAPTGYWVLEWDMRGPGAQPLKQKVFAPDAKSKHNLLKLKWWVWNTMKNVGIVKPKEVVELADVRIMNGAIVPRSGHYVGQPQPITEETSHSRSLELDILENLMAQGPVVYASTYASTYSGTNNNDLTFTEVYKLDRSGGQFFSNNAPEDLRNRPYSAIYFKAPGYYSWNRDPSKQGIGDGKGNGSFGVTDDDGETNLFFAYGKVFVDQPPMHIIYTWKPLGRKIEDHIRQVESLSEQKVKPSYVKGLNREEKSDMKREISRFSKMDHRDRAAYPDDWIADRKYRERLRKEGKKLPKSEHTKEYERRYGK